MKTCYECLCETDVDLLVGYYMARYPMGIEPSLFSRQMYKSMSSTYKDAVRALILKLKTLTPELPVPDDLSDSNEGWVAFCHKTYRDNKKMIDVSVVPVTDLKSMGAATNCILCDYCTWEELFGIYVSEAKFTQDNIIHLLVEMVHAATQVRFANTLEFDADVGYNKNENVAFGNISLDDQITILQGINDAANSLLTRCKKMAGELDMSDDQDAVLKAMSAVFQEVNSKYKEEEMAHVVALL